MGVLAVWMLVFGCSEYSYKSTEGPDPQAPVPTEPDLLPRIEVSPRAIDFGQVEVGAQGTELVMVTNVGDAPLTVYGIGLADPTMPFAVTQLDVSDLAPGAFREFVVTYDPLDAAAVATDVLIDSNDAVEPTATVALAAHGAAPILSIEPEIYDFGEVTRGDTPTVDVRIRNAGDATLILTDHTYTSSSPSELMLVDAGPLALGTAALEPGESFDVTVLYAPVDDHGPDEATLLFDTNDPVNPEGWAMQQGHPSPVQDYLVDVMVSGDDTVRVWIDGVQLKLPNGDLWSLPDTVTTTLSSGPHVVAIHGEDLHQVIAGINAALWVDGSIEYVTGAADWRAVGNEPLKGWRDVGFDDSAWDAAYVCPADEASVWGTYWPEPFYAVGSQWVWPQSCLDLGEGWFRLTLELP